MLQSMLYNVVTYCNVLLTSHVTLLKVVGRHRLSPLM